MKFPPSRPRSVGFQPRAEISWESPSDFSGIKGYFIKLDHEAATVPGPGNGDFTATTTFTTDFLEDGLWYFHVASQDEAGNVGRQAAHFPLRIDTQVQAPALSSPSHPQEGQWYSNSKLEVLFASPQDFSGVEGFYYEINQEPHGLPQPSASLWTTKPAVTFQDVEDGNWYIHVRSKDKAGNLSSHAAHFQAAIDTSADLPALSSLNHPEPERWYRERKAAVQWSDPFEHSGVDGYFYSIDRKPGTVPDEKGGLFTVQRNLSFELSEEGLWYFHILTKDKAGNLSPKAAHFPFRVDTQVGKPFLVSSSHPGENQWSSNPKASFKVVPPQDLSGIAGYYYLLSEDPQAAVDPATSAFTTLGEITVDIPRDGIHYLRLLCQDNAGNLSGEAVCYRLQLDTAVSAAVLRSVTHPNPQAWYASRRVEFEWKDPQDLSGIEGYYFTVNREEVWSPDLREMTWTGARATLATVPGDGAWFLHLCAKDRAGNVGASSKLKVQVDTEAAVPEVKSPTHPLNRWSNNPAPTFQWETPGELSGVEGYYFLLDDAGHTVPTPTHGHWTTQAAYTAPALREGKWYFHLVAKDQAGNVGKGAAHYPVFLDTTAPKCRMKPLGPVTDRTSFPLEWDGADDLSGVASFDLQVKTGDGAWADWLTGTTDKTAVFSGEDGKRYAFRCRARDTAGNVGSYPEAGMVSVAVDISPPQPVAQLTAVPRPQGAVELRWQPAEDKVSGTDYYRVYRWTEGGPREKISADGQVREPHFLDKGDRLADGTVYYYCVQAVDKMGNEQHEGNQAAACVSDHVAGTPLVNSPSHSNDEWSSNPSPLLTWAAPADATGIAGYYHVLDHSPNTRPQGENAIFTEDTQVRLSDLSSGLWYFHLSSKDRAGNISREPAHYHLKLDLDKPASPQVTSSTHPDSSRWYEEGKVQFQLMASPKWSGIECFYWAFDRDPRRPADPNQFQRTAESLVTLKVEEPGLWYFHAMVRDKAGNLSEPARFTVRIAGSELPPPALSSPTHPLEEEPVNNPDPLFAWEDRYEGHFQVAGYVYKLSQEPSETLTARDSFTTERSAQFQGVGEGTWYFHATSVGKDGKPGALVSRRKAVVMRVGKVSGVFLQKDGTTPLSGAKVEMARGGKTVAATQTNTKGEFHLPGMPEGKYEILLYGPQLPVLRLRDVPVSTDDGLAPLSFTEEDGLFPSPPEPGPVRFYYFLKEDCNVTMEIFDSTGARLEKIEEKKEGGAYNITLWDATGKGEGEYLYKLSAKNLTKNAVSKFVVKKFKLRSAAPERAPQPVSS